MFAKWISAVTKRHGSKPPKLNRPQTDGDANPVNEDSQVLGPLPCIGLDASLNYVKFPPEALTRGLAIVGQSGCGKSFLLGRLLEEIHRTTTSSRILILDCDSDFFHGLDPKRRDDFIACLDKCLRTLGTENTSDIRKIELKTYDEAIAEPEQFASHAFYLPNVAAQVRAARPSDSRLDIRPLSLNWKWVAGNHWRYVQIFKGGKPPPGYIQHLMSLMPKGAKLNEVIAQVERHMDSLVDSARKDVLKEVLFDLRHERALGIWDGEAEPHVIGTTNAPSIKWLFPQSRITVLQLESLGGTHSEHVTVLTVLKQLVAAHKYVLSQARLAELAGGKAARDAKLSEYIEAGEFARTFLVIDEAQLYAPETADSPHLRTLSDLLLQIAAEGRKHGIHLILATQRPTKVKRGLLGECSSAIIMKMNSRSDLEHLADQMRILDAKLLEHSLHFQGFGNAIAAGEITRRPPSTLLFRAAPRRSKEGGVDLECY